MIEHCLERHTPPWHDEWLFEAWERMTDGGVQIDYYTKAVKNDWVTDALTFLESIGFKTEYVAH